MNQRYCVAKLSCENKFFKVPLNFIFIHQMKVVFFIYVSFFFNIISLTQFAGACSIDLTFLFNELRRFSFSGTATRVTIYCWSTNLRVMHIFVKLNHWITVHFIFIFIFSCSFKSMNSCFTILDTVSSPAYFNYTVCPPGIYFTS